MSTLRMSHLHLLSIKNISTGLFFLILLTTLGSYSSRDNLTQENSDKPNIVVILTDDQGFADVGYHGSKDIPTPNIDRIAQSGIIFNQGYVTYPVCGPSRAAILSGRYQDRFGSSRNPLFAPNDSTMGLPLSEETMAEALSKADYVSSYIGKWHLGAHWKMYPLQRGFTEFFGFLSGGHRYFPEEWTLRDKSEASGQWDGYITRLMRNNGRFDEKEYITDALSREAVSFVDKQTEEKPFLLFLSYNAPHTPLQASEEYMSRFSQIADKDRQTYAAMMSAVDNGVGNLLDKLEEKNLRDNTIVFFLTDNGGAISDNASSNDPLRGGKGSFFEGGIRVPFVVSYPAVLPAGVTYENPVSSMDIMATAVAEAGVNTKNELDGMNLIPYLTGELNDKPHETLFWRNYDKGISVVRHRNLKLIEEPDQILIYDIEANPVESKDNRIEYHKEEHGHLLKLLNGWKEEMVAPAYLGLLQGEEYNKLNPERFEMVSPYKADQTELDVPEGYELVWSQEFDQSGAIDLKWWNYEEGFVRNEELQWYQPDNVTIQDGLLLFKGRQEKIKNPNYDPESSNWKENREQADYTSASVNTRDKFMFKYGIMEVRARIDTSKGSWPAIWTLGVDRKWPDRGEIDIMEFYRRDGMPTILANGAWYEEEQGRIFWDGSNYPLSGFTEEMPDFPERFHVWRMDWDEDEIKLYLNDELMNTILVEEANYSDGFNPFRQPHFILLNLAIGSNGGDPSKSTFPLNYEVDYVRIYQELKGDGSAGR